jgi:putative nucleotidyltransferase with HDIG domain
MFIEVVECPSHKFGKRRFMLTSDVDMNAIAESSAIFVVINVALGIDDKGRTPRQGTAPTASSEDDPVRAQAVKQEIEHATTALRSSLEAIIGGAAPDIGTLTRVARTMTKTWSDNPVLALEMTRLKTKDEGTYIHSLAVGAMMSALGHALGIDSETTTLFSVAGILHDIGKLLIPIEILNKAGKLTDREREVIQRHPEEGYQLLKNYPDMSPIALDICRLHHEVLDGSGYPLGLKGDELNLPVRISTVCDVFEALTSARPYKRPWPPDEALKWMFARPQLFDRKLVIRLGSALPFKTVEGGEPIK